MKVTYTYYHLDTETNTPHNTPEEKSCEFPDADYKTLMSMAHDGVVHASFTAVKMYNGTTLDVHMIGIRNLKEVEGKRLSNINFLTSVPEAFEAQHICNLSSYETMVQGIRKDPHHDECNILTLYLDEKGDLVGNFSARRKNDKTPLYKTEVKFEKPAGLV